ncbi:two-component system activity regulator YycH [Paenibacillus sp. FSL R10-2782]|uniref:YycH family regulatory protein n=1 Tax=Paenibacillus sp. FSL R10-2782 TaxID=2954661 RepID=UPI00315822A6
MRERLKSWALILLVASSLVQSYFLIYRLPGSDSVLTSETNYVKTESMGQEKKIEKLVFPDKMLIHQGQNKHTVFYPGVAFYDLIFTRLESRSFNSFQRRSIQSADWARIRSENEGMELSFSGGVPVSLLERVMRLTPDSVFQGETINRIWIYIDEKNAKPHALFFSARGDVVYEANQFDMTMEDIRQHVNFAKNAPLYELVDNQYYIPADNLETVQPVVYAGLFTTEQMQRNLFFDPGITRNIQEKDGSQIYTDSKRSLQIKQEQRWMSYTDPSAPGAGGSSSVRDVLAAVDFVNQHGGWDASYQLKMRSSDESRTNVLFQQYYGSYPVLDTPSFRFGTILLEIQQETASVYDRSLLYLKGGEQSSKKVMLPGGETLKKQLEAVAKGITIRDLTPVYQPELINDGLKLVPEWRVTLGDGSVAEIHAVAVTATTSSTAQTQQSQAVKK